MIDIVQEAAHPQQLMHINNSSQTPVSKDTTQSIINSTVSTGLSTRPGNSGNNSTQPGSRVNNSNNNSRMVRVDHSLLNLQLLLQKLLNLLTLTTCSRVL